MDNNTKIVTSRKELDTPGKRLRNLREKRRLTIEGMAMNLDTSKSSLSRMENDDQEIPTKVLINLKKSFNVSPDYILFGNVSDRDFLDLKELSLYGAELLRQLYEYIMSMNR
ncbi:MAG: helix-turn-helix transcriptional regulator [Oscillospiraceae bacterium]|nr:helix-turn-helix transcriptional regulator [Oscillospiraceae bacterium]